MRCAVKECKNTNKKAFKQSFFTFPTNAALMKKWLQFCDRDPKSNAKSLHVCMDHFKPEDIENSLQYKMGFTKKRLLKAGVLPTIKKASKIETYSCNRAERIEKRENKKIVDNLLKEYNEAKTASPKVGKFEMPTPIESREPIVNFIADFPTPLVVNEAEDSVVHMNNELKHLHQDILSIRMALKMQTAEWKALQEKVEKQVRNLKETVLTKNHCEFGNIKELINNFQTYLISRLNANVIKATCAEEDIAQSINLFVENSKLFKLLIKKLHRIPTEHSFG